MTETARPSELDVGTIVADTYEVVRLLGRGGMGAVWEASHRRLPGKKVAIKVLHTEVASDRESLVRFQREAEIASRLGHPHIVEVHDFNTLPSGAPYLVLELLEGESLDARIQRGPMAVDDVAVIVRQIGAALRAAHREGVVHRDLKPQNVFLARPRDGGEVAKVLDFGISKIRGSSTVQTQESSMLGTPQYMSPEQALGNHADVDARTDVFALGAIVYEMLCGAPAFPGHNIPEVVFKVVYQDPEALADKVPSLAPPICEAVHRALAKSQGDRFADVEAFVQVFTGAPLKSARQAALVEDSSRASGREALAATVDSGNRAQMLGTDSTIASSSSPATRAGEAAPATERIGGGGSRIRTALAAAVISALAAAIAVGLIMRSGSNEAAVMPADGGAGELLADSREPDAGRDRRTGGDDDPDAGAAALAGADVEDAASAVAKPAESDRTQPQELERDRAGGATRGRDTSPGDVDLPPEIEGELADAAAALRAGAYERAIRLAERVERRRSTVRGAAIKARAYCAQRDLGNARANWRGLPRRSQVRIARFCANYDIHL